MPSLLCEMKCGVQGITISSSGMLVDSGTSSERASDNDIAIDWDMPVSAPDWLRSSGTDHITLTSLYLVDIFVIVRE